MLGLYPRTSSPCRLTEISPISEAAQTKYCVMHGTSCDPAATELVIDTDYLDANEPVVQQQLQKAGVRLAGLLDAALMN